MTSHPPVESGLDLGSKLHEALERFAEAMRGAEIKHHWHTHFSFYPRDHEPRTTLRVQIVMAQLDLDDAYCIENGIERHGAMKHCRDELRRLYKLEARSL